MYRATFGVSQSTISRAIAAVTSLLGDVLEDHIPMVDDVDDQRRHIIDGALAWVSIPCEGRHHDFRCLTQSGILEDRDTTSWLADKGYIGSDMIIPFRKFHKREQPRWQKDYNFRHSKIRVAVDRAIATSRLGGYPTPTIGGRVTPSPPPSPWSLDSTFTPALNNPLRFRGSLGRVDLVGRGWQGVELGEVLVSGLRCAAVDGSPSALREARECEELDGANSFCAGPLNHPGKG
ncbi:transposase family protein [Actinokineospora globicatena]|uniref:DDE Tnp4 domain-containing protein n=1 Tax=Actinokineospora globicatena TaxID=103729 RepID=A0A9W6QUG9_9PSEU|nr:hypothetical protein Aglo03_58660 [Actinokineospora globicatena]